MKNVDFNCVKTSKPHQIRLKQNKKKSKWSQIFCHLVYSDNLVLKQDEIVSTESVYFNLPSINVVRHAVKSKVGKIVIVLT